MRKCVYDAYEHCLGRIGGFACAYINDDEAVGEHIHTVLGRLEQRKWKWKRRSSLFGFFVVVFLFLFFCSFVLVLLLLFFVFRG